MVLFRRIYRIIALFAWLLVIIVLTIPHRFTGWRGRKKIIQLQRRWMKGAAKITGLRINLRGEVPDVETGLVVSNHLGYVDILVHGAVFPLRFTSTTAIAKWPVLGQIIALAHPVLVDRVSKPAARKALRDFAKTMKRGMYLIVYPEGTSTDGRNGILPFKSTSFEAATYGDLPIIPVLTRYRDVPGGSTVCWYGDMTLMPHLWQVLGLPKIEADVYFMPPVYPEGRSRKELAQCIHAMMDKEYRNITNCAP
jgi:1-acyl-sn-glycerol-3-phosphate acyltransferase